MAAKLEKAQADLTSAKAQFEKLKEALEKAKAELKAKSKDAKLKKKVEGISSNLKKSEEKVKACEEAVKTAEKEKKANNGTLELIRLKVVSKTGKPTYFRAGLQFSNAEKEVEISKEVSEILKNDPWLSVKEVK